MDYINFEIDKLSAAELAELIRHHDECYDRGEPEIGDPLYDKLTRALEACAPEHELLSRIHSMEVASLGEVNHDEPMLSLAKAYSLEDVLEWAGGCCRDDDELLLVEPKYDGISAVLHKGVLATRGDGYIGEEITDKLPLIELETKDYTGRPDRDARGEIVVRNDRFGILQKTIRSKANTVYKNSRNILAPLMKLKEARDILAAEYGMKTNSCYLTLIDYDKISFPVKYSELASEWSSIVSDFKALPYPQDGVVVKLADAAYRSSLGNTAHHPRGEIAFKFENDRRQSSIQKVEWNCGKFSLTPVAVIDPVEINNTTITRVSLHNLQNIIDRDIHIGDQIVVERAGDVIPYIISSTPGTERSNAVISDCPSCGEKLVQTGPELCCTNPDCPETRLQNLAAAVKSLGIENLGEPTLRRMASCLGVRTLHDLFSVKKSDLMRLNNFQERSASRLTGEIAAARRVPDYRFLAALNIPHIGLNIAKLLLRNFTFAELREKSVEELSQVKGIGPERAEALVSALQKESGYLDAMLSEIELLPSRGGAERPRVCFTGKMPEKRSFYEELARANGYEAVDDVNSELALLVASDPEAAGGKLEKARKQGVKIVPLSEFLYGLTIKEPPEISADGGDAEQLSLF